MILHFLIKFVFLEKHSNNFLVHQETIKLVDFGLSRKIIESTTTSTFQLAGMLPYVDPQCLKNNNNQVYKPNKKSDIYSVGILLWELTSGRPPFSDLDVHYQKHALMFDIIDGTREEPIPDTPDKYVNLYKGKNISIYLHVFKFLLIIYLFAECWQDDPKSRPDIQDVKTKLIGMLLGTNIANNDQKQTNEDNSSFSHSSTLIQNEFDEAVKKFEGMVYTVKYTKIEFPNTRIIKMF